MPRCRLLAGRGERTLRMDSTSTEDETQVRQLSLIETLDEAWLKLPLTIMQDVGPAVQTLGGILAIANNPLPELNRNLMENWSW
jgi:hypothetical protein